MDNYLTISGFEKENSYLNGRWRQREIYNNTHFYEFTENSRRYLYWKDDYWMISNALGIKEGIAFTANSQLKGTADWLVCKDGFTNNITVEKYSSLQQ